MIELVFVACLTVNPTVCEDKTLSFLKEGGGPAACMMRAEGELASWISMHPAFRIAKWKCQDAARHESDA